jgi:general stress protein 26
MLKLQTGSISVLFVIFASSASAQISQDSSRQALLSAAREIMVAAGKCALITRGNRGEQEVRTMDPFAPEPDFTIWLATNPNSRKVKQIKRSARVVLYYADKDETGYVTIHGTATLVNEQRKKDARWKEEWKNFYSNRTDNYLLIKITPRYLEVINYTRGVSGNPQTWQPAKVVF